MLLDSDPYNKQVLLRALTQLELLLDDEIVLQNINTLAEKVAESIQDRSCLRLVRKFQHVLSSSRRSLTVSDTTANTETVTGLSVITDVEEQTVDRSESSPGSPECTESDWSDSDDWFQSGFAPSTTKKVVPETPDNSDS